MEFEFTSVATGLPRLYPVDLVITRELDWPYLNAQVITELTIAYTDETPETIDFGTISEDVTMRMSFEGFWHDEHGWWVDAPGVEEFRAPTRLILGEDLKV